MIEMNYSLIFLAILSSCNGDLSERVNPVLLKPMDCQGTNACPKGSRCVHGLCVWENCLAIKEKPETCSWSKDCREYHYCNQHPLKPRCETMSKKKGQSCLITSGSDKFPDQRKCNSSSPLGRCYPQFDYTCIDIPYYLPCTPTYKKSMLKSLPQQYDLVKESDCPEGFECESVQFDNNSEKKVCTPKLTRVPFGTKCKTSTDCGYDVVKQDMRKCLNGECEPEMA